MRLRSGGNSRISYFPPPFASIIASARAARLTGLAAADIERQPLGLRRERGIEECVGRVIDIQKVAALLAAPYLERLAFDDPAQPNTEEGLARILDAHPGPVDIGQPQGARLDAVDVAIQQVVGLARHLVDPVDVDRPQRVTLVDREIFRAGHRSAASRHARSRSRD